MLSQLVVDPNSTDVAAHTAFAPVKLDDQISENLSVAALVTLWKQAQFNITPATPVYHIPSGQLEEADVSYILNQQAGMGSPSGICNATGLTRNVLALQQCTWCHTSETGTSFTHLQNRAPDSPSLPSAFPVGPDQTDGTTLHPSLLDLYYCNAKSVSSANVSYTTYTGGFSNSCMTSSGVNETHRFHDVARRTLFLASLLAEPDNNRGRSPADTFSTPFTE
jgi:hypothetical protein